MYEKWVPSVSLRPPDQIVTSKLKKFFFPSYEHEKKSKIGWLLSNEYQRIWFTEKAKYDLMNYPIKDSKHKQRIEIEGTPPIRLKKRLTMPGRIIINRSRPPYRPE